MEKNALLRLRDELGDIYQKLHHGARVAGIELSREEVVAAMAVAKCLSPNAVLAIMQWAPDQ